MKFCKKCDKNTPTKVTGNKEECMVCGTEIEHDQMKGRQFVNSKTMRSLRELTKTDPDSGKYTSAQNVGRNVFIGLLIILTGILYSMGGLELVLKSVVVGTIALVLLAIILYVLATVVDR